MTLAEGRRLLQVMNVSCDLDAAVDYAVRLQKAFPELRWGVRVRALEPPAPGPALTVRALRKGEAPTGIDFQRD